MSAGVVSRKSASRAADTYAVRGEATLPLNVTASMPPVLPDESPPRSRIVSMLPEVSTATSVAVSVSVSRRVTVPAARSAR